MMYGFSITEYYDDNRTAPEPFGTEFLDHIPKVGEEIQLHWLDGKSAHRVKVIAVRSGLRLDVEAIKENS